MEIVWTAANDLWAKAQMVYHHDQLNWNVFIVVLLLVTLVVIPPELTGIPKLIEGIRMRRERKNQVAVIVTQGFVDFIEERVADETITRAEATEEYTKLKKLYPITELFPSVLLLKEKIQKRRLSGMYDPLEKKKGFTKTVPPRT